MQGTLTPAFWAFKVSNNFQRVASFLRSWNMLSIHPLAIALRQIPTSLDAVWYVLSSMHCSSSFAGHVVETTRHEQVEMHCVPSCHLFTNRCRVAGSVCPRTTALMVEWTLLGVKANTTVRGPSVSTSNGSTVATGGNYAKTLDLACRSFSANTTRTARSRGGKTGWAHASATSTSAFWATNGRALASASCGWPSKTKSRAP